MSTSKNNIQRNVLAPDILFPSLPVGVAQSRLGYAKNANTFVIYFGHALKLVQSSFPKSLSRESAKHGMGITTEHFISEQIARPKWRVGAKCGTKSKQQHQWTTRGVIRRFLKKCVSPLGHPPSIFNETHRLDEKKIKNGAKEGQRWAQWDQTRTNGSQKRAPNCRPNEQQVSSQRWPHAQSGINWTIEKTESPGGQKQPYFVWLVANYEMLLKIYQFTKLLD